MFCPVAAGETSAPSTAIQNKIEIDFARIFGPRALVPDHLYSPPGSGKER
jgi:hypothetical protein